MNVIHIYMQRYARRRLRRERLYRDWGNPLEVYDEIEIKNLFRFQSPHINQITEDVQEHLQRNTGRSRALAPCSYVWRLKHRLKFGPTNI